MTVDPMGDYMHYLPNGSPLGAHEFEPTGETSLQRERWLGMMRQCTSDVVSVIGSDGTVRYVSPNVYRVFGYRPQELVGTLPVHHVHREDRALVQTSFVEASEKPGISTPVRFRVRAADGSWRHVEAIPTNLLDDPDVRGFVVSVRDATGAIRVEEQIRRSRERFKAQYKGFPIPTYSWRKVEDDFVLVDFNDAAHEFTHGSVGALLGKKATELWPEEPVVVETMARCFEQKTTQKLETPWTLLSTGERKHLVVSCVFVPPDMVMVHTQDVTEQKVTEERLRFQADLLGAVGQAVIAIDPEGEVLYWNHAAERLYGWSEEEAMGRKLTELVISEDLWERAEEIMDQLRAGRSWSGEFVVKRKDGTTFSAMITDTPVHNERGDLVGIIGVSTDITDHKEAYERLAESERRFSTVVSNAHAFAYRCLNEPGYPNEFASDYALELTGYPPEDLLASGNVRYGDLIVEEDRQRVWEEVQRALAEHRGFELRYAIRRRDGEIRHVQEHGQGVYGEDGSVVALEGLVHDVTELIETGRRGSGRASGATQRCFLMSRPSSTAASTSPTGWRSSSVTTPWN